MDIIAYDFKVFSDDWVFVAIAPSAQENIAIANDVAKLKEFYQSHKDYIWVGYGSRNYDAYILKGLLCGMNPKIISDELINNNKKGYTLNNAFNAIQLYNYDCSKNESLKVLEGYMGDAIKECPVHHLVNRPLIQDEIEAVVEYCRNKVEQTLAVFIERFEEFKAHIQILETFRLPLDWINLTQAQLSAKVLNCKKRIGHQSDEFDIRLVDTLNLGKYKAVADWFKTHKNYNDKLTVNVGGIPHTFGWGGLHGCTTGAIHIKGKLLHIDVNSYYPTLMLEYDFLTRACQDKDIFRKIYQKRLELKAQSKTKEQAPYKLVLNSAYGISKDKFSTAYDPLQANNVCVNGQLLLLDLIEKLEGYCKLIQTNTDGIIIQYHERNMGQIRRVCSEWERRTHMSLTFDSLTEIWQKDVNNYVALFEDGKIERKGAYVKELSMLDYDLPIVNKAICDYLIKGIRIEDTINSCNYLKPFQRIVKLGDKYKYFWHNGQKRTYKAIRVFASNDKDDGSIYKQKMIGSPVEKIANTPERCFVFNESVNGINAPEKLNKQWYIDLASNRLENFGFFQQFDLF